MQCSSSTDTASFNFSAPRPIGLGHQLTDISADGFLLGIVKQSLGCGAAKLNDARSVDDDHCIRHGVENRAEVAFPGSQRLFELLLLVDIENNPTDVAGNPGVILDQASAGANPLNGSRRPTNPERNVEVAAGLGNPLDRLLGALTVRRFKQGKKQFVSNRLLAGVAGKAPCGGRPLQISGGKIEVPGSDAESLDLEPEMLIAKGVVGRWLNGAGHARAFTSSIQPPPPESASSRSR